MANAKILVVFYSMFGHIHTMAEAVAEGARSVAGTDVTVMQVPELVPDEVLERAARKRHAPPSRTCPSPASTNWPTTTLSCSAPRPASAT